MASIKTVKKEIDAACPILGSIHHTTAVEFIAV